MLILLGMLILIVYIYICCS